MLEDYNSGNDEIDSVAQGVCAGILSFLDTLEEPVSEVTIDGEVDFYDWYLLDYNVEQWMDAVDKLGLTYGDKLEITIKKKED